MTAKKTPKKTPKKPPTKKAPAGALKGAYLKATPLEEVDGWPKKQREPLRARIDALFCEWLAQEWPGATWDSTAGTLTGTRLSRGKVAEVRDRTFEVVAEESRPSKATLAKLLAYLATPDDDGEGWVAVEDLTDDESKDDEEFRKGRKQRCAT